VSSCIDFKKFSQYSKAGPRYTSYPTAVEFHEGFDESCYLQHLAQQDSTRPLSVYVHLPFCRSACYFCGCNVVYTSKEEKKIRYIDYLSKEIDLLRRHVDTRRVVRQIHLGGGTPTFFSPEQIQDVITILTHAFPNISEDAELSCEIDPRYCSDLHMKALKDGGFNRLSFGVQDFDFTVQKAVHRVQSFDETARSLEMAHHHGIHSINIDLIYGLPFQTLQTFSTTLAQIKQLDPDRLAVFNYAHVPWMKKTMRKIDETTLPSATQKLQILEYIIEFLTSNGYQMVGMDHFAKPEDELFQAIQRGELHRNFQGYTTKGGADLLGIGMTSIGEGIDFYAQNHRDIHQYEQAIDEGKLPIFRGITLKKDDIIRKAVIMEMMSNFSLNIPRFEAQFHLTFQDYFHTELIALREFANNGLITITPTSLQVSPTGTMLIRNIVMPFDLYLQNTPENLRRFSKTV
jgi:oxygen-independent coproporphyrinogen III oxidase